MCKIIKSESCVAEVAPVIGKAVGGRPVVCFGRTRDLSAGAVGHGM